MGCKILLGFGVLLAVFSMGMALKCYSCAGTATSDCAKAKNSSMAVQTCYHKNSHSTIPHVHTDTDCNDESCRLQAACITLYVKDYQPKLLGRGCVVVPARSDPCSFLQKHMNLQGCKSCKTDLCNKQQNEEYDPVVNMLF